MERYFSSPGVSQIRSLICLSFLLGKNDLGGGQFREVVCVCVGGGGGGSLR